MKQQKKKLAQLQVSSIEIKRQISMLEKRCKEEDSRAAQLALYRRPFSVSIKPFDVMFEPFSVSIKPFLIYRHPFTLSIQPNMLIKKKAFSVIKKEPFPLILKEEEFKQLRKKEAFQSDIKKKMLHSDMLIEDHLSLEQMGDEVSLFAEDFVEEARAEAREKLKKERDKKQKKYYSKKYTKKSKHKSKRKKEKKKNRFAIKDFNKWFKYSVGYKTTFANLAHASTNREYVKATLTISPVKYFFMGATFKKDISAYHNKYYQPDFSYSFGYADWHPGTISFGYSNYSNNKLNPKGKESRFNFKSGAWDLGYKNKFFNMNFSAGLKYVPIKKKGTFSLKASKVFDNGLLLSSKLKVYLYLNQQQLALTAKKYLYKNFFMMGSVYLYSHLDKQSFLEPDYAYTFGWKAKKKGDISVSYSNYYMPTRWNWREKEGPAFNTGSLSLSVSF